ncbi:MAG: hypothetical protein H0V81_12330 [Solirubrobacterales bacterium]|nr:hypothetical protein [Solirubrobacterales bacterium]
MPFAPRPARRLTGVAGALCLLGPATAAADSRYTRCPEPAGTSVVGAARTSCASVEGVARAVATAPAGGAVSALTAAGWTPYRALEANVRGAAQFDIVALRDKAVLRIRRRGAAPDLDGFSAGRELVFARRAIVGGERIPGGAAFCTSAFTVKLSSGSLGGLSAGHCAGERRNGTTDRRNAAERRPPAPGLVLGRVQRYLPRSLPLDALLLPVPQGTGRTTTAVVDRGIARPPWIVAGVAKTTGGRRMCFTGRTSGPDRCGTLRGSSARPLERFLAIAADAVVRCTTSRAAEGDSGGPAYTRPRSDGTVYALGITTLVTGSRNQMCFTPLAPVLKELDAELFTGT